MKNEEQINNTPEDKKYPTLKRDLKIFFWGGATCLFVLIILFLVDNHFKRIEADKQAIIRAKYENDHVAIIRDSLSRVAIATAKYNAMLSTMNKFDSAKKNLRYSIGQIIYLKPDSIKGVVMDLTADSTLCCYSYFILIGNKDGQQILCERKEKLIY